MKTVIYILAAIFLPLTVHAQLKVPYGQLAVTYRQLTDGSVGQSYHEVRLSCFAGECGLQTVTVNQCWKVFGDEYNFIKVEETSTQGGDLKIISSTKNTIVLEERHSGATFTYRFTYQPTDAGYFGDLKDFSGGAIKSSEIVGKVLTWQFQPVRTKDSTHFETVKLDCPIRVSALSGK